MSPRVSLALLIATCALSACTREQQATYDNFFGLTDSSAAVSEAVEAEVVPPVEPVAEEPPCVPIFRVKECP